MDMFALQPVSPDPTMVPIKTLELAPEGWRLCVQRIAEGFARVAGDHRYCLDCGNILHGVQGHDATCMTMVARRILANEPLLHAQKTKPALPSRVFGEPISQRSSTPITVPVFLHQTTAHTGAPR